MRLSPFSSLAAFTIAIGLVASLARGAHSATDPDQMKYAVGAVKSDFLYLDAETRTMQKDDFSNPGYLWVGKGKTAWSVAEGTAGKSCASCHNAAENTMKGVSATYPKFDQKLGRVIDIEEKINQMRTEQMGAPALKWESDELLSMTAYVGAQSHDMPVAVTTTGAAHATWMAGQAYYNERRGQLNMSCVLCHGVHLDQKLRSETLDRGLTNGFPTYRLSWQSLGSTQRRFRECEQQIRAEPRAYGAAEYVALELYIASMGKGLPVETPAVRK